MIKEYTRYVDPGLCGTSQMQEIGPITIDLRYVSSAEPDYGMGGETPEYTWISMVGRPAVLVKEDYERVRRDLHSIRR